MNLTNDRDVVYKFENLKFNFFFNRVTLIDFDFINDFVEEHGELQRVLGAQCDASHPSFHGRKVTSSFLPWWKGNIILPSMVER